MEQLYAKNVIKKQKIMENRIWTHKLTPGLCIILTKFGEAVHLKRANKIHVQRDLDLSNSEFGNYQKLRYFGLIAHYKNDMGFLEKGCWLLTSRGAKFLKNKLPINRTVSTLNNQVVSRDIAQVFISDIWEEYRLHREKFQGLWLGLPAESSAQAGEQMVLNL